MSFARKLEYWTSRLERASSHWYQGLFDETKLMPQSPHTMRILRILWVLACAGTVAIAQSNTNLEVRTLSLQDCIQLALQHNLDLQIDRYNPQISRFNLAGYYGAYDPSLNLSGQHDHNEAGSQLLAGGFAIPGSVSDDNSFTATLSGVTPIGTTYSLNGSARDQYGRSFGIDTNGSIFGQPFENSGASASVTLSQPLLKNLWIDDNRLIIYVGKNRLKYSELQLKLQIMQTITTLEQAYYDLIYNRENVLVQEKAVELAERLVAENRKKLEVGTLAPLDLQSAENFFRDVADQPFNHIRHRLEAAEGLVRLQHRELGVVPRADAFVAEISVQLEDSRKSTDEKALEI